MFIKQISVFLENKKGALSQVVAALGKDNINILAMSIADTEEFGIVRFIVPSTCVDGALKILRDTGITARTSNVVCVRIPHKPLSLAAVLSKFEEMEISIDYSYSFCSSKTEDAIVILRISKEEDLLDKLEKAGVTLVTSDEVDGF